MNYIGSNGGLRAIAVLSGLLAVTTSLGQIGNYASHLNSGRSLEIKGSSGETMRITPYGDYIVRIQTIRASETFYADDRYEMVARHDWGGTLAVENGASSLIVSTAAADGIMLSISKTPLRISFAIKGGPALLNEKDGTIWSGNTVTESFVSTNNEHFAGLGHEAYGRIPKLDRTGTSLKVSRGNEGACVVPFFVSSKGYGIFLNTTFTHTITLCKNNVYSLMIDGEGFGGRMDYFFIAGPELTKVIDRYTQLTGRPRLPQRSIFGLHLSDKSDPNNNGEQWWKQMITNHRNSGFAIDHQVNDNAWRASKEATSGQMNSWFEFRADRYPNPAAYKRWCDTNGITVTLDLNRPGIPLNPSWKNELSIPGTTDCPDFTNIEARKWIWNLFWTKALNPALGYPGDAIWLDEFDYPDHSHSLTLFSGKKWAEESINYHFNLLKACVQEGWDVAIGEAKRPYFWSRGITAGAQRLGIHWTGDLDGNWGDMQYQVKAMQASGISGFPYFNHDAGSHFNLTANDDNIYRQWDMAFGSFTPIWKPHGPSHKRWPLQRNSTCQATAKKFITTRYQLIPYIYTYAYIAHATGVPMVRSMFLEDQNNETAWQKEMQYYFGREFLVAPNCSDGNNNVPVWLPVGSWYDFWNDTKYNGNQTINYNAATGVLPVFVKAGSVIPMVPFAKGTAFIPKDTLFIHVYTGSNGSFQLYEDDGVTERFRTRSEFRTTDITFSQVDLGLTVPASNGSYTGAPAIRTYRIIYHGLSGSAAMYFNTTTITNYNSLSAIPSNQNGTVWDENSKLLIVQLPSKPINTSFKVANAQTRLLGGLRQRLATSTVRLFPDRIVVTPHDPGPVRLSIHQLNGAIIRSFARTVDTACDPAVFHLGAPLSNGAYLIKVSIDNIEHVRQFVVK